MQKKWRAAGETGFVAVPNVLLTYFHQMDVTPTEFVVLLNLMSHWWSAENRPFPRVATIARRMDTTPRTVQRALNKLRERGLISWRRVQVRNGKIVNKDGVRRRLYDLAPLVDFADRVASDRLEFLADRADRGARSEIAA
jgi:predicted transcriptional regulator